MRLDMATGNRRSLASFAVCVSSIPNDPVIRRSYCQTAHCLYYLLSNFLLPIFECANPSGSRQLAPQRLIRLKSSYRSLPLVDPLRIDNWGRCMMDNACLFWYINQEWKPKHSFRNSPYTRCHYWHPASPRLGNNP